MNGNGDERLLDRIYAAAWDPAALDEALQELALACRSRSAGLFRLHDGALAWDQSWNMPATFMADFVSNAVPRDPRVREGLSRPPLTVMRDDRPSMRRAMCDTGIDDFTRRYDLPYTVSCVLEHSAPGSALALYVSRSADEGRTDAPQLQAFSRYAPHFARAMTLRSRVRGDLLLGADTASGDGLPRLGVLAMDRHRRVRWLDGGAERLLASCDGMRLHGAQLRFDDAIAGKRFERMLQALGDDKPRAHDVLRIFQAQPPGALSLRLLANPTPDRGTRAPVLVLLRRSFHATGDRQGPPMPTQRQGEVLLLLAQGLMSKQISTHLGIAENTVRNHVHGLLQLLQAPNRTACVARARDYGWLD